MIDAGRRRSPPEGRFPADWAGAEPTEGHYDAAVFERLEAACAASRAQGLRPVAVLHHVGLPPWLGPDFWLRLEAPDRFATWAAAVADRLGDDCPDLVTLVEPNAVAWRTWITGSLPPCRVGATGDLVRALDHMLTAHVVARAKVHADRPDVVVALQTAAMPVYELDGLLLDVLAAPTHGVARYDLRSWLIDRRRDWYRNRPPPTTAGALARRVARSAIPLEQALPRAVAAVFDGAHEQPVDHP